MAEVLQSGQVSVGYIFAVKQTPTREERMILAMDLDLLVAHLLLP